MDYTKWPASCSITISRNLKCLINYKYKQKYVTIAFIYSSYNNYCMYYTKTSFSGILAVKLSDFSTETNQFCIRQSDTDTYEKEAID